MYDIIIKNGQLIDGTGKPAFQSDIAIKDGEIVKIETSIVDHSYETIDASNQIRQGVTTEVVGNCGMSAAPLTVDFMEEVRNHLIINSDFGKPDEIGVEWVSFAEYVNF